MLYDPKWQNSAASEMVPSVPEKPELPTFKRRWWFKRDRLDARPVIWSLYNRPDDWEQTSQYRLTHKPSRHVFWVGNGYGFYGLYEANCSCLSTSNRGRFQPFQQRAFHRAFLTWRTPQLRENADHFAAHFVK